MERIEILLKQLKMLFPEYFWGFSIVVDYRNGEILYFYHDLDYGLELHEANSMAWDMYCDMSELLSDFCKEYNLDLRFDNDHDCMWISMIPLYF